ncbi:MAG: RHS repeat-associated core domain-containing protein [Nitrospira sp.]|nr:RHS repeat-associated core domain-containing protein [Nitrospira sp.]
MGGVVTNFVYDGLNPVQEKSGSTVTANLLTGLGIDEFFTRTDGGGSRALLTDALGSTVALGDGTGSLVTQYTYEPFGYTTQTGAASTNSFKYTGREDDGSGLYYYRARYYHLRLQRFISEDPIGFRGRQMNLYGYVRNAPTVYIDPYGLEAGMVGPPVSPLPGDHPTVNGLIQDFNDLRTTPNIGPKITDDGRVILNVLPPPKEDNDPVGSGNGVTITLRGIPCWDWLDKVNDFFGGK